MSLVQPPAAVLCAASFWVRNSCSLRSVLLDRAADLCQFVGGDRGRRSYDWSRSGGERTPTWLP